MYCTICATELPSVAKYCPGCGNAIGVAESEAEAIEIAADGLAEVVEESPAVISDTEAAIQLAEIHENAETDRAAIAASAAVEIANAEATADVAEAEAGAEAAEAVAQTVLATEVSEDEPNTELIEELEDEAEALEEEAEEHLEDAEDLEEEAVEEDSAPVPGHWWFKERGRR